MEKATRSTSEIRQIIEEEISKNPNIGFIKNNDFFVEISMNSEFNKYNYIIVISIAFLIIPDFFLIDKLGPDNIFSKIIFIFNPLTLMFLCLIFSLFFKHYLVFNINNYEFKTSSYLLNKYHFPSLDSNFIDSKEIKGIILDTNIIIERNNKSLIDSIKISLNDNTEKELYNRQQLVFDNINSKYSHETAIELCLLFSNFLNLEFEDRSNIKEIVENEKEIEKTIKDLPYVYALALLCVLIFIIIILLCIFY